MARQASSGSDICLYFLAIFISPLAVFFKRGCGADTWINLALAILGWVPGIIHAWWIISKYEQPAQPRGAVYGSGPVHGGQRDYGYSDVQPVPAGTYSNQAPVLQQAKR